MRRDIVPAFHLTHADDVEIPVTVRVDDEETGRKALVISLNLQGRAGRAGRAGRGPKLAVTTVLMNAQPAIAREDEVAVAVAV